MPNPCKKASGYNALVLCKVHLSQPPLKKRNLFVRHHYLSPPLITSETLLPLVNSMHLLLSLLFGVGIIVAAILSVQNATAVSIQFLAWRSVPIPVGIVLAFALGGGILVGAIASFLWPKPLPRHRRYPDLDDSDFGDDVY